MKLHSDKTSAIMHRAYTHHWPALKDSAGLAMFNMNPVTLVDSLLTDTTSADEVNYNNNYY